MNPASNLFFIGPMGAGKTTIGRHVANLFGMPFYDLDQEIEIRSGVNVMTIFDIEGEEGFRRREKTLLIELVRENGIVLATGGGTVVSEDNRQMLRECGFVVYLHTTIDEQLQRLARDRKRPLLTSSNRREHLQQLAEQRDPLYHEIADFVVPTKAGNHVHSTAHYVFTELTHRWQRSDSFKGHAA